MKLKHILLVAMPAILWSCGASVENNPKAVTTAFVKAMASGDYSSAADLCTKETAKEAEALASMGAGGNEKELEKEVANCKENGDKATCTFCCVKGETEKSYDLEKQDGQWKIKFSKTGNPVGSLDGATDVINNAVEEIKDAADSLQGAVESVEDATDNQ